MFRVVVIGAGPAGSVAAGLLAAAGIDVTIIESRAFPRMKVCGEYISPAATGILESLVNPRDLLAAGARRVDHMALEVDERRVSWRSPNAAWSLSRASLDSLLLEKALASGARVVQPAIVRDVRYADHGVVVSLGAGTTLEADLVIHADGSGRHDPAGPVPLAPNLIAHKCHLRLAHDSPDCIVMRSCAGAYIGTIGVERGLHTCALVAHRDLCVRFKDTDSMVSHLWPAYRPKWREGPWKSSGVARSNYVRPGHPRSIRLGNAAAAVDPVGGEGIGLALWAGAEFGARANQLATLPAAQPAGQLAALARIERGLADAYAARLLTRRPVCQFAAWALMRPGLVRAAWPVLMVPGLAFAPFYRLTGKRVSTARAASVQ